MISRLRSLFTGRAAPRDDAPRAATPSGVDLYAIGDIHGCDAQFGALLAQIARHAASQPPARRIIVTLGDYVDRGPASKAVIERLFNWNDPDFELVALRGNHEHMMATALEDNDAFTHWLRYGGQETLVSYGVAPPRMVTDAEQVEASRTRFTEVFPAHHRAFLASTQLSFEAGGYVFVHAGLRPDVPLGQQSPEDLMWIREEFLNHDAPFPAFVVHGHTPAEAPDVRSNRIGIDTGAYITGNLTALALSGTQRHFLSSNQNP